MKIINIENIKFKLVRGNSSKTGVYSKNFINDCITAIKEHALEDNPLFWTDDEILKARSDFSEWTFIKDGVYQNLKGQKLSTQKFTSIFHSILKKAAYQNTDVVNRYIDPSGEYGVLVNVKNLIPLVK